MATTQVLDRIASWERSGLIDHDLADRLRAAEAAETDALPASQPAVEIATSAARTRSSGFILDFFAYLGGVFLLLAWYAWVANDLPLQEVDRLRALGIAALVPAILLGAAGWMLASRDDERTQRASAVALVAAVPNAGVAAWALLQAAGIETSTGGSVTLVAGAGVALLVAIAARMRRPSMLTQGALLTAWGVFAFEVAGWVEGGLWSRDEFGDITRSTNEELLWNLARLGWWWVIAAIPAIVLVLRPDRSPGHEARDSVARVGIGAIAVLGSGSAALATYDWSSARGGQPVFGVWPAAGIMLGVGVVFVLAARRSGSRIHLVTAGASILIGLSYLNAELVVDALGAPAALLVEGVILLGVAGLGWAAGRLITGKRVASGDIR
jgi:hypothetical protein